MRFSLSRTSFLSLSSMTVCLAMAVPSGLTAQVMPGEYLATVQTSGTTAEMYRVDTGTRKATKLTMSVAARVNCVTMLSPVSGFVGTVDNPAKLYRITVAGTKVNMTLMFKNANALAGEANLSGITRLGSTLYFVTNNDTNTNDATLWSISIGGGVDPTKVYDFTSLAAWRAGGLANAIAGFGTKVYVGVWTLGEIYVYDTATKKGSLFMTLPKTKGTTAVAAYPVAMQVIGNTLHCTSLYGDVYVVNLSTKAVKQYYSATINTGATGRSAFSNSGIYNADMGHYGLGSRDGVLDIVLPVGDGQLGRRDVLGIGSGTTGTANSVNGLYYNAVGGNSYVPYDTGCKSASGYFPTSTGRGIIKKGTRSGFAFGLDSLPKGVNIAVMFIGAKKVKVPLAFLGANCNLLTDPLITIPVPTTAHAIDGDNSATIAVPIPAQNLTLHTQWLVYNTSSRKFDGISDGRTLTVK